MKPIIFSFFAVCFFLSSNAQKSSVYFRVGVNFANVSTSQNGEVDDANMLPSWQVGLMGDIPIGQHFAIQPGVFFTGKGSKIESRDPFNYKAVTNPRYIEIPVNAVLKLPGTGKNPDFFIGLGPYAAIGVAGKREIEGNFLGLFVKSKSSIEYSNDDPSTFDEEEGAGLGVLRRFDLGFNATAGFMGHGGFMIAFNYGYGLTKLQSGVDSEDGRNEHRVISVLFGVRF